MKNGYLKEKIIRFHINIKGIVQGVGFRPFIYNLAKSYSLVGYVLNNTNGVEIEIEGEEKNLRKFLQEIHRESPPLAVIEKISWRILPTKRYIGFEIKSSRKEKNKFLPISPDISICNDCLRELLDPKDRRYHYPFINCTNCGPRFTIMKDIPYDRQSTTMNLFKMCKECESEYNNPLNRRFHAQPNACWKCGPQIKLLDNEGKKIKTDNVILTAANLLKKDFILAVKGIGGYHLACNATNSGVIEKLRARKNRVDKPFALMMLNIDQIKEVCEVNSQEKHLISSPSKPIVLLKRKREDIPPQEIAPKNKYLGVMLPYTPLHYLILQKMMVPLVMTSGNISEEPIAYKDEDAFNKLKKIADFFLIHNRKIQIRVDDSVVRVVNKKPMIIRRSRGYAPQPIKLQVKAKKCVLGMGGYLKNTFCFLKENHGIISHHIGDLENLDALSSLEKGIKYYKKIFYCQPQIIACDLHPNYTSSILAKEYAKKNSLPLVPVQHHHAHIASVLAENHINREVIGVAFDGSGLGTDGAIWGGEFLVTDQTNFKRAAHFRYVRLPGGKAAIEEPWKMAISYLYEIYGNECENIASQIFSNLVKSKKISIVQNLINKQINSPLTSSAGRLFDAVSSLLRIREKINYEGQAAIELEMLAEDKREEHYPFQITKEGKEFIINPLPGVKAIVEEFKKGNNPKVMATKFHWTISQIIWKVCELLRDHWDLNEVALAGGVFQNNLILKQVVTLLTSSGFKVLLPRLVPLNDGGISLGQAVIAYHKVNYNKG